ncbi:MAG: hypothetical protein GXO69_01275, partial [Acidobacteria bacterium]|nr:hypothetical protein [Acidobacteriota bacterium]
IGSASEPYGDALARLFPQSPQLEPPACLSSFLADAAFDPAPGEAPSTEPLYIRKSDAELHRHPSR